MGLMASSILGPATVVLVVQGAFQYVFGMDAIGSLLLALIPVVIFVILCYTTKPDFQIAVAGILTIVYALIMMAVLVGIVGQMTESTQIFAPRVRLCVMITGDGSLGKCFAAHGLVQF